MATDRGDSDSSTETPNKRMKTLENSSPTTPLDAKGKTKLQTCGICLSESAQDDPNSVSRGCIDSCDHYFCFICIMEWAKVESKCPLCKRRFSSILRPAKPPVFPSDRLIHVPERNQVYNEYGNATTGPVDPYSESKCSICQTSVDESLLMLCDLCDSANHTYCVGLGMTVPEGDWFCHDCTLLKDEHNKVEVDAVSEDGKNFNDLNESQVEGEQVTVFDIVREPFNGVRRLISDNYESDSRTHVVRGATNLRARTLGQCRDVHGRIRLLRDNWNSIQNGSVGFFSTQRNHRHTASFNVNSGQSSSSQNVQIFNGHPLEPENTVPSGSTPFLGQKVKKAHVSPEKSKSDLSSAQSSSTSYQRANAVSSPSTASDRNSEISRAWEMLNKAKSIEQRKTTLHLKSSSSKHLSLNRHLEGSANLPAIRKNRDSGVINHNLLKSQMIIPQNPCYSKSANNKIDSVSSPLPIKRMSTSSHVVHCSIQPDVQKGNSLILHEQSFDSPSTASNHSGSSIRMSSSGESAAAVASDLRCTRHELPSLLYCKEDTSRAKDAKGKILNHPNTMRNNDSKSEIQSLVKLNLKLLTTSRKLETAVFKQIARSATHSILVACGLEHPKTGIREFSSSICCHKESDPQFQRSTLMPSSCRECFYVFVKDVVNTIMLEKIGNRDVS